MDGSSPTNSILSVPVGIRSVSLILSSMFLAVDFPEVYFESSALPRLAMHIYYALMAEDDTVNHGKTQSCALSYFLGCVGVLNVSPANIEIDDQSAEQNPDLTSGSYIKLTISDTGHGMGPEVMARIPLKVDTRRYGIQG